MGRGLRDCIYTVQQFNLDLETETVHAQNLPERVQVKS